MILSARCREIGFIFQFPSLLANLAAVDNVALPALLGRTMRPRETYARAYSLLARVGLSNRADAYPDGLSGGEQRRVAIARALINSPSLLLADEPTSDLDEDSEADIIELLERLQRSDGFGFVLVTHNLEAAKHVRRIYLMQQGVLSATDLPEVVTAERRPRHLCAGRQTPAGSVPLKPDGDSAGSVLKIETERIYRHLFEARLRDFTRLFANYMHVRFSDTMLVGLSDTPKDDAFERRDNYYVYLKPFDVADDTVLKRMKFAGKPPVWIPMPPH